MIVAYKQNSVKKIKKTEKFSVFSDAANEEFSVAAKCIFTVICGDKKGIALRYFLSVNGGITQNTGDRMEGFSRGLTNVCVA